MRKWTPSLTLVLFIALIGIVLTTSCSNTQEEEEKKWVDQTFYDLSFEVPATWDLVRKTDAVEFQLPRIRMNTISIKRFEQGETVPNTNLTVDSERDIWVYADAHYSHLKQKAGILNAELKNQERFPVLGKAFYSRVQTKNMRGIDRIRWLIGALINDDYYLITVESERHSHLPPDVKKTLGKFQSSLKIKGQKKDGE